MRGGSQAEGIRPDVIVVGFMKSGTTSLHRWLEQCPEVAGGRHKEPNYFSDESRWRKGPSWYGRQIDDGSGGLTIDSSTQYTDPYLAEVAARRAQETNAAARIVVVARDPLERALSHVRHEVQRGREKRDPSDLATLLTPDSAYVRRSRYAAATSPWFDTFAPQNILVVATETLGGPGWPAVLDHLGLRRRPVPAVVHNETAAKAPYRGLMTSLYRFGPLRRLERHLPRGLRRAARPLLLGHARTGVGAPSPVPPTTQDILDTERAAFEAAITSRGIRCVRPSDDA